MKKDTKICFICSSGGHFFELKQLNKLTERYKSFLVVEKSDNFSTDFCKKIYYISQINRKEFFFFFHLSFLLLRELFIFLKEKPDVVITTGALCSYPMARIAKFFHKKVVYIESFARVDNLSRTGEKMYKFVDLFLVQWPDLLEKYPKAKFVGNVFGE